MFLLLGHKCQIDTSQIKGVQEPEVMKPIRCWNISLYCIIYDISEQYFPHLLRARNLPTAVSSLEWKKKLFFVDTIFVDWTLHSC